MCHTDAWHFHLSYELQLYIKVMCIQSMLLAEQTPGLSRKNTLLIGI